MATTTTYRKDSGTGKVYRRIRTTALDTGGVEREMRDTEEEIDHSSELRTLEQDTESAARTRDAFQAEADEAAARLASLKATLSDR